MAAVQNLTDEEIEALINGTFDDPLPGGQEEQNEDDYIERLLNSMEPADIDIREYKRLPIGTDKKITDPVTGRRVIADSKAGREAEKFNYNLHRKKLLETGIAVKPGELTKFAPAKAAEGRVIIDNRGSLSVKAIKNGAYRLQEFLIKGRAPTTVAEFAKVVAKTRERVPNARHITVNFKDRYGRMSSRTIHGKTPGQIRDDIDRIQLGESAAGSDVVGDSYVLQTNMFDIGAVYPPAGGAYKFTGISKKKASIHPHFTLLDFSAKALEGDCLFAVMRAVAKASNTPAVKERNDTIRTELGLASRTYIPADSIIIDKLANKFGLYIRIITGLEVVPDDEREYDDNPNKPHDRNICISAPVNPIVLASGGKPEAPAADIFLSNGHYEYIRAILDPLQCKITGDIITGEDLRSQDDIRERVLEQKRTWHGSAPPACLPGKPSRAKFKNQRVIVFDYETVYTENGKLIPYALGYIDFDPAPLPGGQDEDDFTNKAGECTQVIRTTDNPFDITRPLLDLLAAAPEDTQYTLVSFNGARFDHYLLAEAAQQRKMLTAVFATGSGGLRSLWVGRHTTLDLAKLLPAMSLAEACKGFATKPKKMEGFDHQIPQSAYENGKLDEWLDSNRALLASYLSRDVLSTASLFVSATTNLTKVTGQPCYGPRAIGTIGGHAYALMCAKCEIPKPVASSKLDELIRSAVVGGRVQSYKGPKHAVDPQPLMMVDFKSLYPTAMAAVEKAQSVFAPEERWGAYPCAASPAGRASKEGKDEPILEKYTPHITQSDWLERGEGKIGIFQVTILEQPKDLPNVLPKRTEGEPLDWAFRGEFSTWCTGIDLSCIARFGGRFEVERAYVWPNKNTKTGLFEPFIRELARLKDEQDEFKKTNDERYNAALRTLYKLLMNSASGKCCQANYEDCVVIATGANAQLAADAKMNQNVPREWIPIGSETCIIIGKKAEERVYTKRAKPSILSVLIYAYSRSLVWRTLLQHNCLYGDTDSGLFSIEDGEALYKHFPQLDCRKRREELGDLEQELKPHHHAEAYLIGAKDYAVFLYDGHCKLLPQDYHKIRVKGINLRSDVRLHALPAGDDLPCRPQDMHDLKKMYTADDACKLSKIENCVEFYKDRVTGKAIKILCSQIQRSFTGDPNSAISPFSLTQRFLIKDM